MDPGEIEKWPLTAPPKVVVKSTYDSFTQEEIQVMIDAAVDLVRDNWQSIVSFYSCRSHHALLISIPDEVASKFTPKVHECRPSVIWMLIDNLTVTISSDSDGSLRVGIEDYGTLPNFVDLCRSSHPRHQNVKFPPGVLIESILRRAQEMSTPSMLKAIDDTFEEMKKGLLGDLIAKNADKIIKYFVEDDPDDGDPYCEIDLRNTEEGRQILERIEKLGFHQCFCLMNYDEKYMLTLKRTGEGPHDMYYVAVTLDMEHREVLREAHRVKRRLLDKD